jgi:hypothetical protein
MFIYNSMCIFLTNSFNNELARNNSNPLAELGVLKANGTTIASYSYNLKVLFFLQICDKNNDTFPRQI